MHIFSSIWELKLTTFTDEILFTETTFTVHLSRVKFEAYTEFEVRTYS